MIGSLQLLLLCTPDKSTPQRADGRLVPETDFQ